MLEGAHQNNTLPSSSQKAESTHWLDSQRPKHSVQREQWVYDWEFSEWEEALEQWGISPKHASNIFASIHRKGAISFDECLNGRLPPKLIQRLKEESGLCLAPLPVETMKPSDDGSVKCLFTIKNGDQVESIYMPSKRRITLCISSQVGCAMGCTFCATGKMGLIRNLSAGEMVAQVLEAQRLFPDPKGNKRRWNIVFMGMGEPLHNLKEVMKACRILTHPAGQQRSSRELSLSTCGLVPKIQELATYQERPRLLVSIAATTDEARSGIMPVNRAYPLETLMDCLASYPLRKNEDIILSYVLIAGVNDSSDDADRLAAMAKRFPSKVNLIPLNEHDESPDMSEPSEESLQQFKAYLVEAGVFTTIRRSRGRDVSGACGQLLTDQRRQKPIKKVRTHTT